MELSSNLLIGGNAAEKAQSRKEDAPDPFFAVYVGISMNPILHEPEVIEVMPYGNRPLRVGDVVFFQSPESDRFVVHRMIRVTPAGISTKGDNSNQEDTFLLNPKDIKGQVVAVLCGGGRKRRKIAGGWQGCLTRHWGRWRQALGHRISPVISPIYQTLSRRQLFSRILPDSFLPRVVVFNALGTDQLQLMSGRRIIGRYDDRKHQWNIQRPFKLFVDIRTLPTPQDVRSNPHVLNELRQPVKTEQPQSAGYDLILADGSHWNIAVGNKEAASIVMQLGCVMQLSRASMVTDPSTHDNHYRLSVEVATPLSMEDCFVPLMEKMKGSFVSVLCPCSHWGGSYINLVKLSLIFARKVQESGGFLIHGALAERDGSGVILAAPGGTGKTTASNRFPAPWHTLCDDTALVVRDVRGHYWAHPWPTWSRFIADGPGGTWDVQHAVSLKGIFFLARSSEDRVEEIGSGHAVSMLVEAVKQASMSMEQWLSAEEIRTLHVKRFDNICALSGMIPSYILHISLTGTFWEEIEQELDLGRYNETREPANKEKGNVA